MKNCIKNVNKAIDTLEEPPLPRINDAKNCLEDPPLKIVF